MASRKIEDLHHNLQPICREFMQKVLDAGVDIIITCTYRSNEEQNELYAQGRTKSGLIVTRARGGQSAHNFTIDGKPAAKAFDIVPMIGGKPIWSVGHKAWTIAGKIGMELGLNWYGAPGSSFVEFPHFQLME